MTFLKKLKFSEFFFLAQEMQLIERSTLVPLVPGSGVGNRSGTGGNQRGSIFGDLGAGTSRRPVAGVMMPCCCLGSSSSC